MDMQWAMEVETRASPVPGVPCELQHVAGSSVLVILVLLYSIQEHRAKIAKQGPVSFGFWVQTVTQVRRGFYCLCFY